MDCTFINVLLTSEETTFPRFTYWNRLLEEIILVTSRRRIELEERVKALEEERNTLRVEVEAMRAVAEAEAQRAIAELEAKSSALEEEVAKLKEQKKALEMSTANAMALVERQEETPKKATVSTVMQPIPA